MKVKDLIEKLKKCDEDGEVYFDDSICRTTIVKVKEFSKSISHSEDREFYVCLKGRD